MDFLFSCDPSHPEFRPLAVCRKLDRAVSVPVNCKMWLRFEPASLEGPPGRRVACASMKQTASQPAVAVSSWRVPLANVRPERSGRWGGINGP